MCVYVRRNEGIGMYICIYVCMYACMYVKIERKHLVSSFACLSLLAFLLFLLYSSKRSWGCSAIADGLFAVSNDELLEKRKNERKLICNHHFFLYFLSIMLSVYTTSRFFHFFNIYIQLLLNEVSFIADFFVSRFVGMMITWVYLWLLIHFSFTCMA